MSSAARKRIPGAHTELATPVPIPTTVVKQLGPMIVQLRESRLVPGPYTEPPFDSDRLGAFFCTSKPTLSLFSGLGSWMKYGIGASDFAMMTPVGWSSTKAVSCRPVVEPRSKRKEILMTELLDRQGGVPQSVPAMISGPVLTLFRVVRRPIPESQLSPGEVTEAPLTSCTSSTRVQHRC